LDRVLGQFKCLEVVVWWSRRIRWLGLTKKNKKIKEERRGLCRLEDGSYGVNGCGVCLGEKVAVAAGSDSLVWRR
jgi:hypothetical protein